LLIKRVIKKLYLFYLMDIQKAGKSVQQHDSFYLASQMELLTLKSTAHLHTS
jgi:hypothetical protein